MAGSTWWLCPNTPPCGHGAVLHDIEEADDPLPRCCAEDCGCGERTDALRELAAAERAARTGPLTIVEEIADAYDVPVSALGPAWR